MQISTFWFNTWNKKKIFLGSTSNNSAFLIKGYVLPYWNDKRAYFDLFGALKETNRVNILEKNNLTLLI